MELRYVVLASLRLHITLLLLAVFAQQHVFAQSITLQCEQPTGCAPHGVIITAVDAGGNALNNVSWSVTGPNGAVLQSTSNPYVAIFNIPGGYDFTVTSAILGSSVFEDFVTVHGRPTASFQVTDAGGCLPFCTSFINTSTPGSGDIIEWNWDFGDGTVDFTQQPTHCYTQAGTYTPVLSIADENGCFASLQMPQMITVSGVSPVSDFQIGAQSSCNLPTNISFNSTSTSASALQWFVNNESAGTSANPSIAFASAGDYDVCLVASNNLGCTDTTCRSLTVSNQPSVGFTMESDTLCAGQTMSFASAAFPTPTAIEWDFNNDGVTNSNTLGTSYTFSNPGQYVVSMTAHFGTVCEMTVVDTITVHNNPTIDFWSNENSSCAYPFEVTFVNAAASQSNSTFTWFVDNTPVATSTDLTYVFTQAGEYDIRLTRENSMGCLRSRIRNNYISIVSPTLSFNHVEAICAGEEVGVSDIAVSNNESIIDYAWDFNQDGTTDAIGANPDYIFEEPGEYTVALTVITEGGCVATDTSDVPLQVFAPVVPNFSVNHNETCSGQDFQYCIDYQPGNTYIWDFHDGSGPVTMYAEDSCLMHTYEDTGYFDVSLTIFNGACNSMITREDFVHVLPPVALFSVDLLCDDYAASFTNESIGGDSIVWDFGDGSPLLVNVANPVHHFPATGQYTVTLKVMIAGYWCSDQKTENVLITQPVPRISITPDEGCSPLSVFIENEKRNFHWELNAENGDHVVVDRVYIPSEPEWTIQYTHNNLTTTTYSEDPLDFDWPTLLFEEPGTYDIHVSTTNYNGCTADTLYQDAVVVLQGGEFSEFTAEVVNPCEDGAVVVAFTSTSPESVGWEWQFSDGSTGTGQQTQHTFVQPFDYNNGLSATLSGRNSDGCVSSRTISIPVTLPPHADFSADQLDVCRFESVAFTNLSAAPQGTQFQWSFGDGGNAEGQQASYAYAENGNYTACLIATNTIGCRDSVCMPEPIIVASPDADILFNAQINNCLYTVNLTDVSTGEISQSFWDFGDNQSGTGTEVQHVYPIGVFNATLITTAQNGCRDTTVADDILNYGESVGPFQQSLDTALCAPFDVVFHAHNVLDNSFQYFWDFNDGQGDPFGGTTTQHTYSEPGTYCPSIIMTDANGCDVYILCQEPIVVSPYQAVYNTPAQICQGDVVEFTSGNADAVEWLNGAADSLSIQQAGFLFVAETSMDIVVSARYSDCASIDTIHLDVQPLPAVSLNLIDSTCYGAGFITLDGGMPGGAGGQYLMGNTAVSSFNTASSAGAYHAVTYRYTDGHGCTNTAADSIYVIPLPTIAPLQPLTFCAGDSIYTFEEDNAIDEVYTIDGIAADYFIPEYRENPYAIALHVEDPHGCYASSTTQFVVLPLAEVIIPAQHFCTGDTIQLSADISLIQGSIQSTVWTIDGVVFANEPNGNPVSYAEGAMHEAQLSVQTTGGCIVTKTTEFQVYDTPVAHFTWSNACEKDSLWLTDQSVIGNDSIAQWVWSAGELNWEGDAIDFCVFDQAGPKPLSLNIISQHGCSSISEQVVEVRPTPSVILHAPAHCLGETTAFEADIDLTYGGISQTSWTIEGFPYTPVGNATTFDFDSAGVYTYTFAAVSNFGCTKTTVDSVSVYPLPQVEITVGQTEFCMLQNIGALCAANVAAPSEITEYTWFIDGAPAASGNPALINLADIGAYALSVDVTTNHGCKNSMDLDAPLVVYPLPSAGFTWTTDESTELPTIVVESLASSDVTAIGYNWGDGYNTDQTETQHTYAEDGTYEILQVVTNAFGCSADTSITIDAFNGFQFFIPEAFTPDDNTHNEFFLPVISGSHITLYVFRVYNRWGTEVFSSKTIGIGWDGTYNDIPVQDGVYTWSVDMIVRGRRDLISKKGSVLLMR